MSILKKIIETRSSIPAKKYLKNCNYSDIFLSCYYEFCAGGAGWDTHLSRLSAFFPQSRETDLHRQALSHSHLMSALHVFSWACTKCIWLTELVYNNNVPSMFQQYWSSLPTFAWQVPSRPDAIWDRSSNWTGIVRNKAIVSKLIFRNVYFGNFLFKIINIRMTKSQTRTRTNIHCLKSFYPTVVQTENLVWLSLNDLWC